MFDLAPFLYVQRSLYFPLQVLFLDVLQQPL